MLHLTINGVVINQSQVLYKSSDQSSTRINTLNPGGTASGKQGNHSRCGSGSVHLNAKILACLACNGNHVLMKCQNFERKTSDERVQIMRKAQLCHRGCLTKGECQVHGCKRRHHTLFHPPYQQGSNVNQADGESVTQTTQIPQTSPDA